MAPIAVGGFKHETNNFAPAKADYRALEQGGGWPGAQFGAAIDAAVAGADIAAAGALTTLRAPGSALADPADFPWTRLRHGMRLGPRGPAFADGL